MKLQNSPFIAGGSEPRLEGTFSRNGTSLAPDRGRTGNGRAHFWPSGGRTRLDQNQHFLHWTRPENLEDFLKFLDQLPEAIFLLEPENEEGVGHIVECSVATYVGSYRKYRWTLSWPIRNCNEQACSHNGYSRDELIGQPAGLVGPITDQLELLEELPEKLAQEKFVRFEGLHRRKDRTLFPVEVSATMVVLNERPLVLCIERELPRWKLGEAHSGNLGAASAEGVNPIMEFDAGGNLTYYNAAAVQLALAVGRTTPVAIVPPGVAGLVKERLETGANHLGLETRIGERTLSWALFPNPTNATVCAYASDVTDLGPQARLPGPAPQAGPGDSQHGNGSGGVLAVGPHRGERGASVQVTDPRQTAAESEESVAVELVRASGDAMIALDLEGNVRYFNPAAELLTGRRADAVVGRPFGSLGILSSESLAATTAAMSGILGGAEGLSIAQIVQGKDGRHVTVDAHLRAIRRSGRMVGVLTTARSLAERRPSEQPLRQRDVSLAVAQRISQTGSWEWRGDEAMEWSAGAFPIFGCQPGTFNPTRSGMLEMVHPSNRDLVKQTSERAWRTATAYRLEYRVVQPDGSQRVVQEQAEVLCDDAGKPDRMVGAIQDITERKQQEEQLRHLEKWEAIGRLAGGVAHDFNNILADIRRCIEVIQASPNIKDELSVQLKALATTAERATNLTWQLLAYSRKPVIQSKPVNVNVAIQQLRETLRRVLGEDIDLQTKLVSELPTISADASMLEQVFLNLAIKARHAMQQGGRLTIETRVATIDGAYVQQRPDASVGQFICLGITATGAGLDSAATACIFEPFFTTKQSGQSTGLVLATVYSIIKQHQGWIDVFREVERGATFKIYLPVRGQTEKPEPPVTGSASDSISGGKETILLVEDEPLLRALAQSILERYGYQILQAGSGAEALNAWEKQGDKIDLLLTDMVMPGGMSGQELAQRLQARKPQLKVVYTCGYNVDSMPRDLVLKPGLNFIPKPYSASALAQTVRNCLDQESTTHTRKSAG
ncbi:MAG: PAS domain S-box protein [Limisphaerales bacterium]